MKNFNRFLPHLLLSVLGLLAMGARAALYSAADPNGLLPDGHPMGYVLIALTLCAFSAAVPAAKRYAPALDQGRISAIGAAALGCAILLTGHSSTAMPTLNRLHSMLSFAAAAACVWIICLALLKKPAFFAPYAIVCAFFCIHMVISYQLWSERPQLTDYVFGLGAVLSLAVFACQRGASLAGLPAAPAQTFCALVGIFFCLAALPRADWKPLYCAGAVWLLTELTALHPRRKD